MVNMKEQRQGQGAASERSRSFLKGGSSSSSFKNKMMLVILLVVLCWYTFLSDGVDATTAAGGARVDDVDYYHLEAGAAIPGTTSPPVKVFILAGQSNMVGHGSLEHLQQLVQPAEQQQQQQTTKNCPCCNEYYTFWDDTTNTFRVRNDNIYYKWNEFHGRLRPGKPLRGASSLDDDHSGDEEIGEKFGPELGFGWMIGNTMHHHDSSSSDTTAASSSSQPPIFILKTAWGGRSLAYDFRPPSSGPYRGERPTIRSNNNNDENEHAGWQYREMIHTIQSTLDNDLANIIPDYDSNTVGYSIEGLVWFQGWNDVIEDDYVQEYEYNLGNLVRDVRVDLHVPDLPVVIGELGQAGVSPTGNEAQQHMHIRQAQYNVANSVEFRDTTRLVGTARYIPTNIDIGGITWDGGYHYYGRADIMIQIGKAFGTSMMELLNYSSSSSVVRLHEIRKTLLCKIQCRSSFFPSSSFSSAKTRHDSTDPVTLGGIVSSPTTCPPDWF